MSWRVAKTGAPCWPSARKRPNRWRRAATITTPSGPPAISRRHGRADELWLNGKTLPSACDRLFSVWRGAGKQTPLDILARMKLALKEGNSSLVSNLYSQLPADYQTMGNATVRLQNDPTTVEAFARSVGPTDFTRAATGIAFERGAAGCGKRAGDDPDACAAAENERRRAAGAGRGGGTAPDGQRCHL